VDEDLIFDVGMGNGDDSAHYLSQGYRVVAVEANPARCAAARTRFAGEIEEGRLVIEPLAIDSERGQATFYVTTAHGDFSALDRDVAARDGHEVQEVTVDTAPLTDLFEHHGVPRYLKVDIEGKDLVCLQGLQGRAGEDLPPYVSVEAHGLEYLALLWTAGYRRFKVVDQTAHNDPRVPISRETLLGRLRHTLRYHARANPRLRGRYVRNPQFPDGSSGPIGPATPGPWKDLETVAYEWLHVHHGHRNRGHLEQRAWFDFHAAIDAD
jgi:FkbM family methyltransferase